MQLGHESSNRLKTNVDQQLINGAQLHGPRAENKDTRLMQLDLMIRGQSKVMRKLKKSILRAADCSSTVLIMGESGTGKELITRSIHELGARQREPFLAINCGALTESLLESELFGHVKGAFTGATGYRKGMFESAGKGTIFLDEFGEMSSLMQVRLLRVLQEHKVRPVGSEDAREINFKARIAISGERLQKEGSATIFITALTLFQSGRPPCATVLMTYRFSLMLYWTSMSIAPSSSEPFVSIQMHSACSGIILGPEM